MSNKNFSLKYKRPKPLLINLSNDNVFMKKLFSLSLPSLFFLLIYKIKTLNHVLFLPFLLYHVPPTK